MLAPWCLALMTLLMIKEPKIPGSSLLLQLFIFQGCLLQGRNGPEHWGILHALYLLQQWEGGAVASSYNVSGFEL